MSFKLRIYQRLVAICCLLSSGQVFCPVPQIFQLIKNNQWEQVTDLVASYGSNSKGFQQEMLKTLDKEGKTPFHHAAMVGAIEIVIYFSEQFPELINKRDIFGRCALTEAIESSSPDSDKVVAVLLDAGAEIHGCTLQGKTPLVVAGCLTNYPKDPADLVKKNKIIALLEAKGAPFSPVPDCLWNQEKTSVTEQKTECKESDYGYRAGAVGPAEEDPFNNRFRDSVFGFGSSRSSSSSSSYRSSPSSSSSSSAYRQQAPSSARAGKQWQKQSLGCVSLDMFKPVVDTAYDEKEREGKGEHPNTPLRLVLPPSVGHSKFTFQKSDEPSLLGQALAHQDYQKSWKLVETGQIRMYPTHVKFINQLNATLGTTPLMYAVQEQHYEDVKCLLRLGAMPDLADVHGQTPLAMAQLLWHRDNPKVEQVYGELLSSSDARTQPAPYWCTELYSHLLHEAYDKAFELVRDRAQWHSYYDTMINAPDKLGDCPLIRAVKKGERERMEALIMLGANVLAFDRNQLSSVDWVEKCNLKYYFDKARQGRAGWLACQCLDEEKGRAESSDEETLELLTLDPPALQRQFSDRSDDLSSGRTSPSQWNVEVRNEGSDSDTVNADEGDEPQYIKDLLLDPADIQKAKVHYYLPYEGVDAEQDENCDPELTPEDLEKLGLD